jgi:hypothetical protein
LGAAIASYVGRTAIVYAIGIFVCGILAAFLEYAAPTRRCHHFQHRGADFARACVGLCLASFFSKCPWGLLWP